MQPVQLPFHLQPALVTVNDTGLAQLAVNLDQRRFAASCHGLIGLRHQGPQSIMYGIRIGNRIYIGLRRIVRQVLPEEQQWSI